MLNSPIQRMNNRLALSPGKNRIQPVKADSHKLRNFGTKFFPIRKTLRRRTSAGLVTRHRQQPILHRQVLFIPRQHICKRHIREQLRVFGINKGKCKRSCIRIRLRKIYKPVRLQRLIRQTNRLPRNLPTFQILILKLSQILQILRRKNNPRMPLHHLLNRRAIPRNRIGRKLKAPHLALAFMWRPRIVRHLPEPLAATLQNRKCIIKIIRRLFDIDHRILQIGCTPNPKSEPPLYRQRPLRNNRRIKRPAKPGRIHIAHLTICRAKPHIPGINMPLVHRQTIFATDIY